MIKMIWLKENGPIDNSKDNIKPVGDPESTVKLFEIFRARCTEQLTKKLLVVLNRQISAG